MAAACHTGLGPRPLQQRADPVPRALARLGDRAVGIAVPGGDLVGLFCVAVDPALRCTGLGRALVRALLSRTDASRAYLQVEETNLPALALYARLGFTESHRYCHRTHG